MEALDGALSAHSNRTQASRLSWPVRIVLAVLWISTMAWGAFISEPKARLIVVGSLGAMALGGTLIALVAKRRNWRPGLAVEGLSVVLAAVGLWAIGFLPMLIFAGLIGGLLAALFSRWKQREPGWSLAVGKSGVYFGVWSLLACLLWMVVALFDTNTYPPRVGIQLPLLLFGCALLGGFGWARNRPLWEPCLALFLVTMLMLTQFDRHNVVHFSDGPPTFWRTFRWTAGVNFPWAAVLGLLPLVGFYTCELAWRRLRSTMRFRRDAV
jgi:hypothetical protein